MNIIDLLHHRVFAVDLESVRMMLVDRVFMLELTLLYAKFPQRAFIAIFFQVIENSLCRDAIYKPQHISYFSTAIRDHVRMIQHYYIRENQYFTRSPGFVERVTDDLFERVRLKNWYSLMCYRGQIICRRCSRYLKHWERRRSREIFSQPDGKAELFRTSNGIAEDLEVGV